MPTSFTVSVLNPDNTLESTSGAFDGYIYGVGLNLFIHYNTPKKIKDLISQGAICCLKEKLHPDINLPHSLSKPQKEVSTFYLRDRKRKDYGSVFNVHKPVEYYKTKYFTDLSSFAQSKHFDEEYNYVFCMNQHEWFWVEPTSKALMSLEDKILEALSCINSDGFLENFKEAQIVNQKLKLEKELKILEQSPPLPSPNKI